MKTNYNQNFWYKQYSNEENIKQWFKNYLTYLDGHIHELQNMNEIKEMFLQGEKREIETTINNPKKQKELFEFMKKIIENLEV